jgi:hypothetical protein
MVPAVRPEDGLALDARAIYETSSKTRVLKRPRVKLQVRDW